MKKYTPLLKMICREQRFCAVYLAGAVAPYAHVSIAAFDILDRPGANMAIGDLVSPSWAIRIGTTSSLEDTLTPQADGWSPHMTLRVHWRLWTVNRNEGKRLETLARHVLRRHGEPLRKSWFDLGRHADLDLLRFEVQMAAKDHLPAPCWDDQQFFEILFQRELQRRRADRQRLAG